MPPMPSSRARGGATYFYCPKWDSRTQFPRARGRNDAATSDLESEVPSPTRAWAQQRVDLESLVVALCNHQSKPRAWAQQRVDLESTLFSPVPARPWAQPFPTLIIIISPARPRSGCLPTFPIQKFKIRLIIRNYHGYL